MTSSITAVNYVSSKLVAVSSFVPSNRFVFASGEQITVSGVVNMKLVGQQRMLRSLEGDSVVPAMEVDGNAVSSYEVLVELKGDAELVLGVEVPAGNSGPAKQANGHVVLGMAALAACFI